jgi:hypothetical protein
MHTLDRDDLHLAVEFVTGGGSYGAEAYIDLRSGAILYSGSDAEEPLPKGVHNTKRYLRVPTKKELDLGRDDALAFTEQHAPQLLERAEYIFHAAGAFDRLWVLRRTSNGWRARLSFGQTRRHEERILERSIRLRGNEVWPNDSKRSR